KIMSAFTIGVITTFLLIINLAEHGPEFFRNTFYCQNYEENYYSDVEDELDYYTEYDQYGDYDQYE
ncbi:29556_t:CDS:1, partial [Racocetra persica]